jgi:hypothetical protein
LVNARIFLEGGGDSKELQSRCRAGFRKLLESTGFAGRMPALVACGGRTAAFRDFGTQHAKAEPGSFVGLLVDSEDPVDDAEQPWKHLMERDGKAVKPNDAQDEQVFLMTTCMETWIVCDRATLKGHYGASLQDSAFPPLIDLEKRGRAEVQKALERATRNCTNAYAKGQRSFEILGTLDPDALAGHLPSFARMRRILRDKLRS